MKGFLKGFIVFLVYATLCVVLISYTNNDSLINDAAARSSESNEILERQEFTDASFEDSTTMGTVNSENLEGLVGDKKNIDLLNDRIEEPIASEEIQEIDEPVSVNIAPALFNISLPNGTGLIQCKAFAKVFKDQARVKIPYACREYGVSIKSFLEKNPRTTLKITGYTDPSEPSNTGTSRSEYLKKLLTNTGISSDRIIATSAVHQLDFKSGSANGGVEMEINGAIDNGNLSVPSKPNETNKEDKNTSKSLASKKFTTGFQGNYFYGDQKFTAYTSTIKSILDNNPESSVYAYSYTEGSSDPNESFAISRDNASTVRKILLQSGIAANRIKSIARGQEKTGTSGTNRCIIIVIK